MAEALTRMASYALRLEGVGRRFGALVALDQVLAVISAAGGPEGQPGDRKGKSSD
jgi:hypothetical protein